MLLTFFTQPWWLAHRADLHHELVTLATGVDGQGPPAKLHLSSKVESIDHEEGIIWLQDGDEHRADLIVGADGVHVRIKHPTSTVPYNL